jgi:ribosome biogenesis GTPase
MIDSNLIERLRGIGLTNAHIQQLAQLEDTVTDAATMRIVEVQREGITLHDGHSEHAARQLPALRAALAEQADSLAVGDWVRATRNSYGEWWVHQRVPPLNQLARRLHDGRDKVVRTVIVSNVDTAVLVMGLDHDYNLRRLERYVALARMACIASVVVLTKRDLCPCAAQRLAEVQDMLPVDVPAVAVDAQHDEPSQALRDWLQPGQTLVLLGSSGAGKSTLTNALTNARTNAHADALTHATTDALTQTPVTHKVQATGSNRAGDNRGRHTTVVRSMHQTASGACIIDTPGLRTLRLDGDASELGAAFDDIARLALQCRFRDCGHGEEPGCAVRAAVSPERLRNYGRLLREARRDTLSALERKSQLSQWKARARNARARIEAKRG